MALQRTALPLLLLAFGLVAAVVAADPATTQFRVSLIHGQNDEITDNLQECAKFRQSLVRLFGYARYERLGTATGNVTIGTPAYLQPTWAFGMKVQADPSTANLYHYELFQEKQPMFKGRFVPKDDIPLIIRGPEYNRGILILVVYKQAP